MFYYENLAFRPIEKRDLEVIRKLRNDQSTWLNLTDVHLINPVEQEKWYEVMSVDKSRQYYVIVEVIKGFPVIEEKEVIGMVRFDCIDDSNHSVRVGFDIISTKRGKGYGTRAMLAIEKYCFDHWGKHSLWLFTLEDNKIARKLYEGAGFKECGKLKHAIWRNGKWNDYIMMAILQDEYRK